MRAGKSGQGRVVGGGRRKMGRRAYVEFLERRVFLSVAPAVNAENYSAGTMLGTWGLSGTAFEGTISFDGAGAINGGTLTDVNGGTNTASGPYVVSASGEFGLGNNGNVTSTGAISATRDVATFSQSGDNNFNVIVRNSGSGFVNTDMAGTWTIGLNGATAVTNGIGTVVLDALGQVKSGTLTVGTGNLTVTGGSYTMGANGDVTLALNVKNKAGVTSVENFVGAMNGSKDVVALDPPSLEAAAAASGSNLVVMMKSAGSYSNVDLNGAWVVSQVNGSNDTLVFDGAGHITLTGTNGATSGTYTVTSAGKVTIKLPGFVEMGAMNGSKNAMVMNSESASGNATDQNALNVFISSSDHGPTVAASGVLAETALQTSAVTFTYADILKASGAKDLDGDALTLQVTAATQNFGCLTIVHGGNRTAVGVGTVIVAGDTVEFDTGAHNTGKLTLFSVKASDGTLASSGAATVQVNAVALPVVSASATVATVESALVGNAAGNGVITLTRSGFMSSGNLSVKINVGGTAIPGPNYILTDSNGETLVDGSTVTFLPGQTSVKINVVPQASDTITATKTVIVTVAEDPNLGHAQYAAGAGAKGSATVTWFGAVPTVTIKAGESFIREGGTATFILTRTLPRGVTSETTNVSLSYGGSFSGTTSGPTVVTFTGKQTSATVVVTTTIDPTANPTDTLVATIQGGNAVVGAGTSATVDVLDLAPIVSVKASKPKASEIKPTTTGQGAFTFTRSGGDLTQPLTVNVNWSGQAVNGTDYVALPTAVTFLAHQTTAVLLVTPNDTQLNNLTQTVVATVASGSLYHASPVTATVTIQDVRIPPVSGAGNTIQATITGGTGQFLKVGSYTLILSQSTNEYVVLGNGTLGTAGSIPSSTGTYTYTVVSSTDAVIHFTDSLAHQSTGVLTFSTPTSAVFSYTSPSQNGTQTGKMTLAAPTTTLALQDAGGRTISAKVTSGTGIFATSQAFTLILSQSSGNYVLQNIPSPGVSTGTYSYDGTFAKNLGIVTYSDSITGSGTMYVLFKTATTGTFTSLKSDGDEQRGTMALNTVPAHGFAPTTIAQDVIGLSLTGGVGIYPPKGTVLEKYFATTYTEKDLTQTVIAQGNFTYEQYTPTIGIIMATDSLRSGQEVSILTWTAADAGSFLTLNILNTSDQTGKFSLIA